MISRWILLREIGKERTSKEIEGRRSLTRWNFSLPPFVCSPNTWALDWALSLGFCGAGRSLIVVGKFARSIAALR